MLHFFFFSFSEEPCGCVCVCATVARCHGSPIFVQVSFANRIFTVSDTPCVIIRALSCFNASRFAALTCIEKERERKKEKKNKITKWL